MENVAAAPASDDELIAEMHAREDRERREQEALDRARVAEQVRSKKAEREAQHRSRGERIAELRADLGALKRISALLDTLSSKSRNALDAGGYRSEDGAIFPPGERLGRFARKLDVQLAALEHEHRAEVAAAKQA